MYRRGLHNIPQMSHRGIYITGQPSYAIIGMKNHRLATTCASTRQQTFLCSLKTNLVGADYCEQHENALIKTQPAQVIGAKFLVSASTNDLAAIDSVMSPQALSPSMLSAGSGNDNSLTRHEFLLFLVKIARCHVIMPPQPYLYHCENGGPNWQLADNVPVHSVGRSFIQ